MSKKGISALSGKITELVNLQYNGQGYLNIEKNTSKENTYTAWPLVFVQTQISTHISSHLSAYYRKYRLNEVSLR